MIPLAFRRYGSGPPIVVLHGLLGSRENWHSICLRLAVEFEVFAVDQRNHGASPHAEGMTYHELAADLAEFIATEVRGSAHLIGHSMGGKCAMQLALKRPELVRSLVAVDISPTAYPPKHRRILDGLLGIDLAIYQTRKQVEEALAEAIPDLATCRFLLKNLTHMPGGGLRWRIGLQEINAGYAKLSARITGERPFAGPALFLKGERSDYLRESDLPLIRGHFSMAQLKVVPRAGHWVQADNPDGLLKAILEFFRQPIKREPAP